MSSITGIHIIKKDGTKEPFNIEKVVKAISLSADRVMIEFTDAELDNFCNEVMVKVAELVESKGKTEIEVAEMHKIVEGSLDTISDKVAKSYRDYRNYKTSFVKMLDAVFKDAQKIMYIGDRENSNTDSALVSTKRSLIYNSLNKELYKRFFLRVDELQAIKDGYIYIHDMSARRDTMNCFDKYTRFITNKGVKAFADFNDGDVVVVPTHTGEWKNATVRCYGKQKLRSMFLKRSPRSTPVEIKCTDNHRWILRNGLVTTNIKVGDKLFKTPVIADIEWDDMTADEKLWTVVDIKDNYYEDEVWCLEVEDNHSFILEGGIVTGNCCLCDIQSILSGGFELANQWYTEPKSLDTAFDVIGDIVLSAASQQYGGFTVPQIDQVLKKYAEMSYTKYYNESYEKEKESLKFYTEQLKNENLSEDEKKIIRRIKNRALTRAKKVSEEEALRKIRRDYQQGFQGWEYKFNTVASSRGDYPFITMTFGLGTSLLERMASIEMCNVRAKGQGKPGFERIVLFPKLVMLYDKRIHGKGKVANDVKEAALKCSSKAMYPDWLSLEPGSYVGDMYQKYGKVVSPMGKCNVSPCKTFLTLVA